MPFCPWGLHNSYQFCSSMCASSWPGYCAVCCLNQNWSSWKTLLAVTILPNWSRILGRMGAVAIVVKQSWHWCGNWKVPGSMPGFDSQLLLHVVSLGKKVYPHCLSHPAVKLAEHLNVGSGHTLKCSLYLALLWKKIKKKKKKIQLRLAQLVSNLSHYFKYCSLSTSTHNHWNSVDWLQGHIQNF